MSICNRLNALPFRGWHIPPPVPVTSWEQIIAIEPRLERVIKEARRRRGQGNPWRHYQELKRVLSKHVGWCAPNPRLRSDHAYSAAVSRLAEALGV